MSKYAAFFVSEQVHERKVTLADGSEHVVFFKEVPATVYRKFLLAEQSEDDDVRASSLAQLIAASMCEADGSPAMTFKQAKQLKAGVSGSLVNAVLEVNGQKPGNVLPPGEKSGFGTSSPSPLAEEQ